MQVKKFEASSMKGALATVKKELGPDAIILAAKEMTQPKGGVQVTAAVALSHLKSKRVAEKKMTKSFREKFEAASALKQKKFIDESQYEKEGGQIIPLRQPYIEIQNDQESITSSPPESKFAGGQIRGVDAQGQERADTGAEQGRKFLALEGQLSNRNSQIRNLKTEVSKLRSVIKEFQKVPQSFLKLHPGAKWGVPFELSFVYDLLRKKGVNKEICLDIIKETEDRVPMSKMSSKAFISAFVVQVILDKAKVVKEPATSSKFHIFVGPSGEGKTNTLVKMAAQWSLVDKKHVAIVSSYNQKIGAREQLKIFAQILNIPFIQMDEKSNWAEVDQYFGDLDHILVDCPSIDFRNPTEASDCLASLPLDLSDCRIHYVLSALARDQESVHIARQYNLFPVDDVIFTRLEECQTPGTILNFQFAIGWPLFCFGIGQEIPEDLERATPERIADLIFDLAKFSQGSGSVLDPRDQLTADKLKHGGAHGDLS